MADSYPEPRRVLILTSSTGGGHDMRANAFKAWAESEAGKPFNLQVSIHQALEATHGVYHFGVNLYNRIQQFWPKLHHIYFNFLEHACLHDSAGKIWGRQRFLRAVLRVRPHVVLSTHAHLNHGFLELAKRALPRTPPKCVTYCGELSGGYGFSHHWVNPKLDLFIGAVEETCDAASHLGMSDRRNWVGGFLLDPAFYEARPNSAERRRYLRQQFDLDPDRFVLVLGTGANGANNHMRVLRAFAEANIYPQIIALCGSRTDTIHRIEAWQKLNPRFQIRCLPYYEQMHLLLGSASAVVARSGTGTTSESILSRCPIILNGIGGVMPQECITVKFCRNKGIGTLLERTHKLPSIVGEWMRNPALIEGIRQRMAEVEPRNHPLDILRRIRELADST